MPSVNESQRKLFALVLAAKRGQLKNPSPKVKKVAQGVSEGSASDFAKKREGVVKSLQPKSGY